MTPAAVRRAVLAAQGLADPLPGSEVTRRALMRVFSRIHVVQMDSVNVAVRAHYMPLYSRLGGYSRELLDEAAYAHTARRPRLLTEYWAHEASLIPVRDWPLLRWRMRTFAANPGRYWQAHQPPAELAGKVRALIADSGPMGAGGVERALGLGGDRASGGWWNRSSVKRCCEWMFAVGELSTAARRGFERLYDFPERVLPADVLGREIDDETAARELTRKAAAALGVATEADLRDYYRLTPRRSRAAVAELADAGELVPVRVPDWPAPSYRYRDTRTPRAVRARALLCPFDPLVWRRERAERVFGFRYRIEIYTPEHKREHGYYVFPFLLGDELVARVDLKAEREAGALAVRAAFAEDGVDRGYVASELASELHAMAKWLGLGDVRTDARGDLGAAVRVAL
jgi:uncharacterized protein YcaQ